MNREFEVQLRESLYSVHHGRSWWEDYPITTLNLAVLILGFVSLAIGYILNGVPRETLIQVFGNRAAIEVPVRTQSAAEALTELPRALASFLIG